MLNNILALSVRLFCFDICIFVRLPRMLHRQGKTFGNMIQDLAQNSIVSVTLFFTAKDFLLFSWDTTI